MAKFSTAKKILSKFPYFSLIKANGDVHVIKKSTLIDVWISEYILTYLYLDQLCISHDNVPLLQLKKVKKHHGDSEWSKKNPFQEHQSKKNVRD